MSVIVFYPNDAVDILLNSKLFKTYRYEPLDDCTAKEMVEAYYGRMKSIERHVSTPIHSMPNIYFEVEKIAYELGKDFLEPFFDETIKGCEGFMALQCIDAGAWGKHYASIILFGTDSKGDPLPSTNGFKFFEKWPGRLLTETEDVIDLYFPGCSEKSAMSTPPNGTIEMDSVFQFRTARRLTKNFTDRWEHLDRHLSIPTNLPPVIPALDKQPAALSITKNDLLNEILNVGTPAVIACILCFNDKNTPATMRDDTLSVLLVGLDSSYAPVSNKIVEKWPELFFLDHHSYVQNLILTDKNDPQRFKVERMQAQDFYDKWNELLKYVVPNPTSPKPDLRILNQPLVFFIDPSKLSLLANNPDASTIACVFGYHKSAGYDLIAPSFVAVDDDNQPISDILHTKDSFDNKYLVKDIQHVLTTLLNK
jgi:hypothetical protein